MGVKSVRKTNEEFIKECTIVHNQYYDYSKTNYTGAKNKVTITCPIHGDFEQKASHHLSGSGCKYCTYTKDKTGLFFGIAINDCKESESKAYKKWVSMLERCYSQKFKNKKPTYKNCTACDEWLIFSNFKQWFENNYIDGYELDKDILVLGNKVYSPETCCFVPHIINQVMNSLNKRGVFLRKDTGKYQVKVYKYGKQETVGNFENLQDAELAYKKAKNDYLIQLATEYYTKGLISEKIYNALLNNFRDLIEKAEDLI
jgi:hypothetical protein